MGVILHIILQKDGIVSKAEILDKTRYKKDNIFRTVADSALKAVHESSSLQNLPANQYYGNEGWHEVQMLFDPINMH